MAKKSYTFAELSDEAKKKVIERERDNYLKNLDIDYWSETVIENFKTYMTEKYGIEVDEVGFDISYSQGDGASFTFDRQGIAQMNQDIDSENNPFLIGFDGDKKVLEYIKKECTENGDVMIARCERTNFHYQHERTVTAYVEADVNSIMSPFTEEEFIDKLFTVADGWNKYENLQPETTTTYFKTPDNGMIEYDDTKKYDTYTCGNPDQKWYHTPFTYAELVRIANDYNIDSAKLNKAGFSLLENHGLASDIENYLEDNDIFDIAAFVISLITSPVFAKEVGEEKAMTTEELFAEHPELGYVSKLENEIDKLVDVLESNLEQVVVDESKQLYKDLRESYEDATSDESISEWLEVNDMGEYTEDGEIYYGDMPKLTYRELSDVVKNKLNSQYYDVYNFFDMNEVMISDKLEKITELGFKNPRFEYDYPNGDYTSMQVKLRFDSYDFAVAKTWILAGLPQDIIDSTTSEKDIPEQYKEFCNNNKKALFAGIDRTTTDLFRSTYIEDTSEEAIESYYDGDLFFPDGTPVDEVDDDE